MWNRLIPVLRRIRRAMTMNISQIIPAGIIIIRVGIHPGTTDMHMLRPDL
jgi:hypothetical protein